MPLLLPVGQRRMSSWKAHQHRNPRSQEPGTDFYCPIGTPVYAPEDGRVYGYGESIIPATGRWVGLDLVNGQRFRAMHFSRIELSRTVLNNRGFVRKGQLIAYSGASGYGKENWENDPNTGGAHTHVTLWPTQVTRFGYNPSTGLPYTVDFMNYVGGNSGGGGNEEDDMNAEQANQLAFCYAALAGPANLGVEKTVWARPFGDTPGSAYYGMFDVAIHTQNLVTSQTAQITALSAAVSALTSATGADPAVIAKTVETAVTDAMKSLTLKIE